MINFKANQLKKPRGIFGRYLFNKLEKFNLPIYEKTLEQIEIPPGDKILEIGYGTGRLINMIMNTYPGITMTGIDFSSTMHKRASCFNKTFIAAGTLTLHACDFMQYDGPENDFNTIIGLNVIYFFDLDMINKIFSLLNPSGNAVLYMNDPEQLRQFGLGPAKAFHKHEISDVISKMEQTGFRKIQQLPYTSSTENGFFIIAIK